MPASWNSYSKSETARSPRSTTRARCSRTKSMSRPLKPSTCTFFTSASTSLAIAMRSSTVKNGRFAVLSAMASTSWSNSVLARRTRSSWPRVSGSNVPGYTALIIASPLEELVAHLAGARALQLGPALARDGGRVRFDVEPRLVRHSPLEADQHRRERILPERGIEENHVETLARLCEITQRVAFHEVHCASADTLARSFERRKRRAVTLDHHDARRTARSRFEAERSAAREKIEASEAVEPLSEPVEERFAHAIGCRAQSWPRGNLDAAPAVFARDDAHFCFVRMH